MKKRLQQSDFKRRKEDILIATYLGKSRYLTNGKEYYVARLVNKPDKVSVPYYLNKDRLFMSNGGVQFPISQFEIEVEEKENMISLKDLSVEDREALLQEAREQIEQENIDRDAKAMYAIKKRELLDNTLEEISKVYRLKHEPHKRKIKERIVSLASVLYKFLVHDSANLTISTKEEWERYEQILNNIKSMMIATYKGQKIVVEVNHDN